MTPDNSTGEPLHRRLTTLRALRGLEATTHLTTAAAFVLTVVLVSTAQAGEANPIAAGLLSTTGWATTGLAALVVATVTFAYLGHHRRTAPRVVAAGAVLLAALGVADLAVNVWTLSQVGWPESVYWAKYGTPVGVVGVAGVVATARRELASLASSVGRWSPRPSSRTVAAVVFSVLLVGSIIGPFAAFGGLVETDHGGTASAQLDGGSSMIVGGGSLIKYDESNGDVLWENTEHPEGITGVEPSPNNEYVYVTSGDNAGSEFWLKKHRVDDGSVVWEKQIPNAQPRSLGLHPDGSEVYVGNYDGEIYAYPSDGGSELWNNTATLGGQANGISVSPEGEGLYVADAATKAHKLYTENGSQVWTATNNDGNSGQVYDIEVDGNNAYVYVAGLEDYSTEVSKLNATDGSRVWDKQPSPDNIYALTIGPNDERIYTAQDNGAITEYFPNGSQGWRVNEGGTARDIYANQDSVYYIADGSPIRELDTSDGSELTSRDIGGNGAITGGYEHSVGHPITGTVTDNGGDPVDGATVSTDSGVSTTTGSDGSYELTVEETGTYDVTAETAIDSDTQTVDVPDGGLTSVDFSLQSGTVAGTVEDQNGNPVADATVTTITYNTKDPNVDTNLEELREIVESPLPPQWNDVKSREGVGERDLVEGTSDVDPSAYDFNGTTVLMHESESWGLDGVDWPVSDTKLLPNADINELRIAVAAEERPAFSCWRPPEGFRDEAFEDPLGQDLDGVVNAECDEITIEKLDSTGSVTETTTLSPQPEIRVRSPWSLGKGQLTTTYDVARPDLEAGFYRVYPDDNEGAAMTYAVAPNANPEKIKNQIVDVTNSEIEAQTDYQQRILEEHDAGNIDIKTTTTNDRGEFSFEIDETVVEEVELRAAKSGTGVEAQLASGELNEQQLSSDFEDTVRSEFNTFDKSSLSLEEADVGSQEFADVCRQMGSVPEQLGAPYTGSASTEVPNPDVTITGQRAPIPDGVSQPVRECATLNYAQQALEDPGSLLPGVAGDIAEMAREELNGHYENLLNLLNGNEDIKSEVEAELGRDLPEDPSQLDRDEVETVVRDGLDSVDNPSDGIDVGGDDDGGLGGGDGGGVLPGDDGPPVVDDPEDVTDRVNETITREWPITGVDDWNEAGLLIRIDYADGTSETLSRDSEYVTLEESYTGPDTIRLEEFPFGEDDAAVANIRLDVSTPQGIGGGEDPIRNPTFDGNIPGLDSIRLSDTAPGPSDAVTVGATPAEAAQFGQLERVNVTGPDCTRSEVATDNEATFTTCGQGAHRVAVTFTNGDGVEFTEVLSVDAGNAAQARDPLIRGASGPTGRFAVAGNGLESGRIDVSAGTSEVTLTAIVPTDADVPNRVTASTTGVDVARDATTTVRIRQGSNEQTIRDRIGIVLHTEAVGNESLLWRNDRPIRNPGESPDASVEHHNQSTTIDSFSSDTATMTVEVDRDPSFFTSALHSIRIRFPALPISVQPTNWLTALGSIGDGLPAPVQVGGGPMVVLGAGVAAARRVQP